MLTELNAFDDKLDASQQEHIKKLKDKFADLKDEINLMGKGTYAFNFCASIPS